MTPFLKLVANDVYSRFNGHLENVAVVFPNKRAALFFNKYLLENSGNVPIWSPRYMTISELFQQNSILTVGDPILLVSKLYKEYIKPMEHSERKVETLDSFYYWGEMLVRDFDDIDKNLADARKLFANIRELHEMGTAKDTLSEEQARLINRFFENFKPEEKSDIKKNFQDIWERLFAIYTGFKESLRKEHIAYEGMLYRDVIENSDNLKLEFDKYLFVGFNALNGVETRLFSMLEKSGKALFYWDYDEHYVKAHFHEAGHFMRRNLERFPNALKGEKFNHLAEKKNVSVVSASSDSIQARYLSQWLDKNFTEQEIETAVVLCDETMLEPVLHTIPEKANGNDLRYLNVTMGYPISSTPIFSLVKQLVDLQLRGWSVKHGAFSIAYVCTLLKHPYVIAMSSNSIELRERLIKEKRFYPTTEELYADEFLKRIFTRHTDNKEWMESIAAIVFDVASVTANNGEDRHELYSKLFSEATLKVHTQVQRLVRLLESGELNIEQQTAGRLLVRMLSMQSMPFHGEPVVGLQVMGLLETRNLDFKNVIMLSVNEGNIPKGNGENSYIPYNLRRAFGLTLSEHRDSIYAYYFYRLLQRAENVTLVYNNSTDSKSGGECSRYILQLLGSNLYDVERIALSAEQGGEKLSNGTIAKTTQMVDTLRRRFDTGVDKNACVLTPSAINRYLKCKLNFFYYYVLGLKPLEDIDTEMRPTDFGIVFHKAAEEVYKDIVKRSGGNDIDKSALDVELLDNGLSLDCFGNLAESLCCGDNRIVIRIGGNNELFSDLAVYLNCDFDFIVNALCFVIGGPARLIEHTLKACNLPDFLGNVRNEGVEESDIGFKLRLVDCALCVNLVGESHKSGNCGVILEIFDIARDLLDCLVNKAFELLGIAVAFRNHIGETPDSVDESLAALNRRIAPGRCLFIVAHKENVCSENVGTELVNNLVGVNDVAL